MEKKLVIIRPAISDSEHEKIVQAASDAGYTPVFLDPKQVSESDYMDAEIIYGEGAAAKKAAAESDSLKWLCASFAGVDAFCRPGAFRNESTLLTNSAGAYGVSLAEHAIMMALMMMRRMPVFEEGIRNRRWLPPLPQDSIKDSVVTLLGTGDVGSCLARRLRGFEPTKIIGVCRSGRCEEPAFDEICAIDRLKEVLGRTNLLIMSLPATAQTKHILNEEMLSAIKPGAYVVNVGRGNTIDEKALTAALNEKRLAGAALDVMETEPLPEDSPLWDTPNLILTPHVAGNLTVDYTRNRNTEMFCEDLVRYAKGQSLLHLVDRTAGY